MNLNVLSMDVYFTEAIHHLFHALGEGIKYQSIVCIDVMNPPKLNSDKKQYVTDADCLMFVVNGPTDHLLIHDKILEHIKKKVVVQYICRSSPICAYEELLKGVVIHRKIEMEMKTPFNSSELKLINSIRSGTSIKQNSIYKDTNQKTFSGWKRSIMKKLNINGDIHLYLIVMKCCYLTDWFYYIYR